MGPKERILAVLNCEAVDRLPVDIWHTDEVLHMLMGHYGATDDLDLYQRMGVDKVVWVFPIYNADEGATGSTHLGQAARSMWGTPLRAIQAGEALYQEFGEAPLREYETPVSLEDYPFWPDPGRFDYEQMTEQARKGNERFAVLGPWVSVFEIYCQMRGIETALMDVALNADLVHAALDRIELCQTEMMKRFLDLASPFVDMVFISDDMGCQTGPLVSVKTWETFFRDRLQRWCELIHGYGLRAFYHTDGGVGPLIPHLLDCGIDVLNPIQHICPGMDRSELKRQYGDRVIFHGGVENQCVLPRGSADDVREETRQCLKTLGAGRAGYIVCSCHNIQPGTPIENIIAMVETVHEEGTVG